ncbi:MAG: hypothetical protein HZB65_03065 [Candidatus Aenigmarchaeota archaeon]|nr:hypothetical protein [Candidatus Aenigmarchaeota archaeon]
MQTGNSMKLTNFTEKTVDMPKLQSMCLRDTVNNAYVCTPRIDDELRWVFTEESEAIEKLDGTNTSITVKNGQIIAINNRLNPVIWWKKGSKRFIEGITEAIEKEYIKIEELEDGQYFGELIGPSVNANPYQLDKHLWLPFAFMREHLRYKFWDDFVKELKGLSDEEILAKTSELFKTLWSLYKRRRGIKGEVDENTVFTGMAAEGIVFYAKNTNEMAKLRRDMFDWFIANQVNTK